ncbi:hypothetical protein [Amycolatopsis nigrescens]|uniref:hypothetical protein n=1 Tax=Amycolatopsis nigrescens TaxID=381445 RepID=UPI000365CB39|nr:hypothetical protein [Amycolatopsis nigrescens]
MNRHQTGEPGARTRTDRAVEWVVWHIGELASIGVPLVLAAAVSWWFVVLAVLAGAGWTVHEIRQHRTRPAALAAGPDPARLAGTDDHTTAPAGQTGERSEQGKEASA